MFWMVAVAVDKDSCCSGDNENDRNSRNGERSGRNGCKLRGMTDNGNRW
jgi:hypothetical protein